MAGQSWRRIARALDMPLSLLRRHVQRYGDYYRRWRRRYRRLVYRQLLLQTRIECLRVLRRHLRANDPKAALQAAQLLIRLELHRQPSRHKQPLRPSQSPPASLRPERSQSPPASPPPPRRRAVEPHPPVPNAHSAATGHGLRSPDPDGPLSAIFDGPLSAIDQMVRRLDRQQLLRLWERRFRRECRRRGIVIPGVDLTDEAPDVATLDKKLRLRLERLADPQLREKLRLALLGPWGETDASDPNAPDANARHVNLCDADLCQANPCAMNPCAASTCAAYSCHPEACDAPASNPATRDTQARDMPTSDRHASDGNPADVHVCDPSLDDAPIAESDRRDGAAGDTDTGDTDTGDADTGDGNWCGEVPGDDAAGDTDTGDAADPALAAAGPADAASPIPPAAPSG